MMIAAGLIWFYVKWKDKKLFGFFLTTVIVQVIFVYQGGRSYFYYTYCFSIYAAAAYLWLNQVECSKRVQKIIAAAMMITAIIPAWQAVQNHENADPDTLVQYRFAKEIKENSTLLTYNQLDIGFYNSADLTPSLYYSWATNLFRKEIREAQNKYIQDQIPDYIVSPKELSQEILNGNYTCYASHEMTLRRSD